MAHPDFHVVTKELARFSDDASVRARKLTSIPVGVLRSTLIEPVSRSAQLGQAKVFIVDEAHLLNPTGQNLLLKTLEEPPPRTYIILVTDSEDRLLTTIRSRCQRIAFVPLSEQLVAQWLDGQPDQLDTDHRDWLIRFALGCPGRVRLAIDYDLFVWAQTVLPALEQMTEGAFPAQLGQQIFQFIDDFAKRWVKDHDGSSKEAANRLASALMAGVIAAHARSRIAQIASQCDPADPDASHALLEPWLGAVDALSTAERELATNVNLSIVADHLVAMLYQSLSGFNWATASV